MIQTFLVIDSTTKQILSICFTYEKAQEIRLEYILKNLLDNKEISESLNRFYIYTPNPNIGLEIPNYI